MILAHLADIHLGFSGYDRTVQGRNVRTRDVEEAFQDALGQVVALKPDLVILAGDLLDHPHPDSGVLVALTDGLALLREGLPDVPVLAVAGERDTPLLRVDPGVLAALDRLPGVEAAASAPRSIFLPRLETHVLLLPHRSIRQQPYPSLRPETESAHNIAVLHGRPESEQGLAVVPEGWSYIALGSGHHFRQFEGPVVDPGSIERVSVDPWSEALEEKGFVTFEIGASEAVFHPVVGRPVVDLAPVLFDPAKPEDLNRRIRDAVGVIPGGIEGKLVRMRIRNLSGSNSGVVDAELMGSLRERAMFLRVDFEPPGPEQIRVGGPSEGGASHCIRLAGERSGADDTLVAGVLDALSEVSEVDSLESVSTPPPLLAILDGASGPVAVVSDPDQDSTGLSGSSETDYPWRSASPAPGPGGYRGPERRRGGIRRALAALLELRAGKDLEKLAAAFSPFGALMRERPEGRLRGELAGLESRIDEVELAVRRLPTWEQELRDLRADAAVVGGDLEASITEWLRERQDAETHLMAYRDRARELKVRLSQLEAGGEESACPTCGRSLGHSTAEVARTLREEWESVVQDGQWWKRRREQVEFKPESIRELESGAHQLHASIEGLAERLEGARVGRRDLEDLRARRDLLRMELGDAADDLDPPPSPPGAAGEPAFQPTFGSEDPRVAESALALVEEAQRLMDAAARSDLEVRASAILNRISVGRLSGIRVLDRDIELLRDGRPSHTHPVSDRVLLDLALRLAVAWFADEMGKGQGRIFEVGFELERLPGWIQTAVLRALDRVVHAGVPVLVWSEGALVESVPEGLARIASLGDSGESPRQVLSSGPPPFHFATSAQSDSDQLPRSTQASARS